MSSPVRTTLIAGLLATSIISTNLPAQAPCNPLLVPPGFSSDDLSAILDVVLKDEDITTNSRPLWGLSAHKMPSDPAGQWTICLTIRGLKGYGNGGFSGIVIGEWNPTAKTPFVLKEYANKVNGAFVDYIFNLEPANGKTGGRYGVFDRFQLVSGTKYLGIYFTQRKDDRSAFEEPMCVTNVKGLQNFGDPALGYVNGKLMLFYAGVIRDKNNQWVQGILMDELINVPVTSGKPAVAGKPVLVARPIDPLAESHAPTPIQGADGDVEGLFVAEGLQSADRSDIYFAADLDPDTPYVRALTSKSWLSAGGIAGGSFLASDREAASLKPRLAQGAWLVGDEEAPGGTADLTMNAYSVPGGKPATVHVFLGFSQWRPMTIPGFFGQLGIFPMARIATGTTDADQVASFQLKVPNKAGLHGLTIPIQGLAEHTVGTSSVITLTNTATLRIRKK